MPPVAAAAAATATFLASTAVTIGTVAISWGTILMTTTSLASSLIAISKKPQVDVADPSRNIGIGVEAFTPRKCVYGKAGVSGDRIFADTYSSNQKLGQVLALSIGAISGITTIKMDETTVSTDGSGIVQTNPWATKMRVQTSSGTDDKTAYTVLSSGSSYWTANHRGRGISDAFFECEFDQQAYSGGIPTPLFIGNYALVYDPRKDTTQGGSGTHRSDDPTTWEFSRSGPLQALHYILGVYQNGKRVWGLGVPVSLIDLDSFADAADICEAVVSSKPRFTSGGRISDSDNPRQVIDSFAASFGGAIFQSGGLIRCMAAAPIPATITLTDDDLDGGVEFVGNPPWRDAVNTVRVRFTDPDRDWRPNTTSDITDSAYVTEDGGEVLDDEFPASLCEDADCAHRLGRLYLANNREPRTIRARWKAKAFRLREGVTVTINSARLGVNEKMIVLERSLRPDGTVTLTTRTETDAKYTAMDDFTQAMPSFARVDRYDPSTVSAPSVNDWTAAAAAIAANGASTPSIRVTGSITDPLMRGALIEYRPTGESDWKQWEEVKSGSVVSEISAIAPGTQYDVQIRLRNVSGVLGDPLVVSEVLSPADLISTDTANVGVRTAAEVNAAIDAAATAAATANADVATASARIDVEQKRLNNTLASVAAAFALLSSGQAAADDQNLLRKVETSSLSAQADGFSADITSLQSVTVDLENDKAEAADLTALELLVGTDDGQGALFGRAASLEGTVASLETDKAEVTRVESIEAQIGTDDGGGTLFSRVATVETTVVDLENDKAESSVVTAIDARVTTVEGEASTNAASIVTLSETVATGDRAAARRIDRLLAEAASQIAAVVAESAVSVDTAQISARRITGLEVSVGTDDGAGTLFARTAAAESTIIDLEADKAEASAVTTLEATVNTNTSNITVNASAISDLESAAAHYTIVVAASGSNPAVATLQAGKNGSDIQFVADRIMLSNMGSGENEYLPVMEATGGEAFFARPIYIDGPSGSGTHTILGTFGPTGGEMVMWTGPNTTFAATATRANSYVAQGINGKFYFGSADGNPWEALKPQTHYAADGGTVSFNPPYPAEPEYDISSLGLAALSAGDVYDLRLTDFTTDGNGEYDGATVYAKIISTSSQVAVTCNTQAAFGSFDQSLDKDADEIADAYDGKYYFFISGQVEVVNDGEGPEGSITLDFSAFRVNTGHLPTAKVRKTLTAQQLGISTTATTGVKSFTSVPVLIQIDDAIGDAVDATYFGVSKVSQTYGTASITDLVKVTYTKDGGASASTATPAGQLAKIVTRPS